MNETPLSAENLPELCDRAKRAIDVAATFEEVASVRDQAEMYRQFAKRINAGVEAQNRCAEIRLRAERRMGEELEKLEKQGPGQYQQRSDDATVAIPPTLAEIGVTKDQSSRYQQIASLPEDQFEMHIEHKKSNGEEITTAGVLDAVKQMLADEAAADGRDPKPKKPPLKAYLEMIALGRELKSSGLLDNDPHKVIADCDSTFRPHLVDSIKTCAAFWSTYEALIGDIDEPQTN
jgi:hypothetical protein